MLLRLMSEKGKYEQVYLAFIDILGFKSILQQKCAKTPNYLLQLFSDADAASHRDEFYGIKKIYLSDSILMWTTNKAAIPYLVENCHALQEKLFHKGHLVRGVIVKGKHYTGNIESLETRLNKRISFPDHIIVSPVLVKAYIKEQSLKIPVIKAEGAVLNDMPKLKTKKSKSPKGKRYQKDLFYFGSDYSGHFSYLYQLLKSETKGWEKELKKEFRSVVRLRNMTETNLQGSQGGAKRKWRYVAKIFNAHLKLMQKDLTEKALSIPKINFK